MRLLTNAISLGLLSSIDRFASAYESIQVPLISKSKVITPELEEYVWKLLDESSIPGLTLGVVSNDGGVETKGFGVRNEDGDPVDADTLFYIGSCSKAFTALGLSILVDDFAHARNTTALPPGLPSISWNTKVKDVLPDEWEMYDEWATEKASLADVLSHVSGLPRHDFSYAPNDTSKHATSTLKYLKPQYELRQQWSYNNIMFMLAAHIIDTYAAPLNFTTFITDRIFLPAGMTSTTYSRPQALSSGNLSQGWFLSNNGVARRIPSAVTSESEELISGAGGVTSSARDMTRWLQLLLAGGRNPATNKTIIPASVFQASLDAQRVVTPKSSFREISLETYGMGWFQDTYGGHNRIWHSGSIHGFLTHTSFYPDDGLGIFVSFNSYNTPPVAELVSFKTAEVALGLKGRKSVDQHEEERGLGMDFRLNPVRNQNLTSASYGDPDTDEDEMLAGTYHHPGYGTIHFCHLDPSKSRLPPSETCNQTRSDFGILGVKHGVAATWPRVWSSHLLLAPLQYTTFELIGLSIYPNGFGKDKSPFYVIHGAVFVTFVKKKDGVLGFGFYEDPQFVRPRHATEKEVKESSTAWFTKVA